MTHTPGHFNLFKDKMEAEGLPSQVVEAFAHYYDKLVHGHSGKLAEADISPLGRGEVPRLSRLGRHSGAGLKALDKLVVIKLNGGLGTSMGLERGKSLLPVKDGLNFLDITIQQVRRLRRVSGLPVPLLLMNSFRTHQDTLEAVQGFDNSGAGLPLAFLQNKYPKVVRADLTPALCPGNPDLEWNPPGHGDLYTALAASGGLERLLSAGYRWAFISNSDNLGAIFDASILGYCVAERPPLVMEVARRTRADRKGGHLARRADGRLVLREVAQCPDDELDAFQDVERYRYFNTNSLWLDLRALQREFSARGMLELDLIVNPKTVDPRDPKSQEVYQLETAMGSAISAFEGAKAVRVPRGRFAPVKTTSDLLAVMSDCYILTRDAFVVPNPKRLLPPVSVSLDPGYYARIDDFMDRFPQGAPSLMDCESLKITGDVVVKADAVLKGKVSIVNPGPGPMVVDGATPVMAEG